MILLERAGRRARGRRGRRRRPLEPLRQADGPAAARRQRDRHDLPLAHPRPARASAAAPTSSSPPSAAPQMVERRLGQAGRDGHRRRHQPHGRRPRRRRRLRRRRAEVAGAITPVPGGVGPDDDRLPAAQHAEGRADGGRGGRLSVRAAAPRGLAPARRRAVAVPRARCRSTGSRAGAHAAGARSAGRCSRSIVADRGARRSLVVALHRAPARATPVNVAARRRPHGARADRAARDRSSSRSCQPGRRHRHRAAAPGPGSPPLGCAQGGCVALDAGRAHRPARARGRAPPRARAARARAASRIAAA